jgi:hypothetical protein
VLDGFGAGHSVWVVMTLRPWGSYEVHSL